jgi:rhodanese-related sulfurtransferase
MKQELKIPDDNPRRELFFHFALIGKALAHGHRLELIDMLAQGERSVEDLAGALKLSVANTSQHLQRLLRVGLVNTRKQGQRVYYRLADDAVTGLLMSMRHIAKSNLAEVRDIGAEHFDSRDDLEAVSRAELLDRIGRGEAIVVDVRPAGEYAAGHVSGAVNIPVDVLERELENLPRDKEIVAYCRGPYCALVYRAVAVMREKGYMVRRLEEGFPQWKHAGLPIEAGAQGNS